MGYYILDRGQNRPSPAAAGNEGEMDTVQWVAKLENGTPEQRQVALRELIARGAEDALVSCLASVDAATARLAMHGLWECWQGECGPLARARLDAGIEAMHDGNLNGAAETFRDLITEHPGWAEAINKLATVCYLQGHMEKSIELCQQVVAIKPDHFGAWNGMTICAIQAEQWQVALESVRQSLRLQPHSPTNLQLLTLIESRLPVMEQ